MGQPHRKKLIVGVVDKNRVHTTDLDSRDINVQRIFEGELKLFLFSLQKLSKVNGDNKNRFLKNVVKFLENVIHIFGVEKIQTKQK